jgi:hypothetical protein
VLTVRTCFDSMLLIRSRWASVGDNPAVYLTALSVGWNPHFEGDDPMSAARGGTASHSATGKTLEPWLLHHFSRDFYDEELRLVVVGYIRPEAPFTTLTVGHSHPPQGDSHIYCSPRSRWVIHTYLKAIHTYMVGDSHPPQGDSHIYCSPRSRWVIHTYLKAIHTYMVGDSHPSRGDSHMFGVSL